MDITRRSDYACRILRAVYKNGDKHISVADIAEKENIPYAFARSIQHDLVKSGLVKAIRGARGGLILDCDPQKVTLHEVLEAVQGSMSVSACAEDPSVCDKSDHCDYNRVWRGIDNLVEEYLSSITLDELFKQGDKHPVIKGAIDGTALILE